MQVTRWRRYGKDRLYVKDADGYDLGWWDLVANTAHPTSHETEQALLEAVAAWQTTEVSPGTVPGSPPGDPGARPGSRADPGPAPRP